MSQRSKERKRPKASDNGFEYKSKSSPHGGNDTSQQTLNEISKIIADLNGLTKSIEQKTNLFGTTKDTRRNHKEVHDLIEKGKEASLIIQRHLISLSKSKTEATSKTISAQCRKLSHDFKAQVEAFEAIVKKAVTSELNSVENIKRVSTKMSSSIDSNVGNQLCNYSEDQIYSSAHINEYDEDALQRREDDIIRINQQLDEVNQAYQKIDDLIVKQEEVVLNVISDTDVARQDVQDGLVHIHAANQKSGYCGCSKAKLCGLAVFTVVVAIIALSVVLAK